MARQVLPLLQLHAPHWAQSDHPTNQAPTRPGDAPHLNICHGTCTKHTAPKLRGVGNGIRYTNGAKRCQNCSIYITWKGNHCPCCGGKLRNGPRGKTFKALREVRRIQ